MGNLSACCNPSKDGDYPQGSIGNPVREGVHGPSREHYHAWLNRRMPDDPQFSIGDPYTVEHYGREFPQVGGMSATNPLFTKHRDATKTSIGIALDGTEILGLTPLGAAARSGQLNIGDVITAVDGQAVDEDTILEALKGSDQVGSALTVAVARPPHRTGQTRLVRLVREPRM